MKKLMICLMLAILLVGTVSALEFDNVKDVIDVGTKYPDVKIDNLFGIGATIWEGSLTGNTETCITNCEAGLTIILPDDGSLIDDIIFKTKQEDGSFIEQEIRSYSIQYWGTIIDYKTDCTYKDNIRNCVDTEIGSHEDWIHYNEGDVLPAGTYTVKLTGEKKPERVVDWIIKTQGKWIDEWALWGADSGVMAYYNFDDNASNTVVEDAFGGINGTTVRNTTDMSVDGIINTALDFNGSGDYVELNRKYNFTNQNFSIGYWLKLNTDSSRGGFYQHNTTTARGVFLGKGSAGVMTFRVADTSGNVVATDAPQYLGEWAFYTATYDAVNKNMSIYV